MPALNSHSRSLLPTLHMISANIVVSYFINGYYQEFSGYSVSWIVFLCFVQLLCSLLRCWIRVHKPPYDITNVVLRQYTYLYLELHLHYRSSEKQTNVVISLVNMAEIMFSFDVHVSLCARNGNTNSSKTAKATDFKFDNVMHVPRDSLHMTP